MEDWNKKLVTAARHRDIKALKLCLQNGADIDYQDGDGVTALMNAAMGGHLEICQLLIDTGCKIDITEGDGVTALMSAAGGGQLEICRLLIDTGCKIDITDGRGLTALMWAAEGGHLEVCRLLVDRGCKIDITTAIDGYTALHYAAWNAYLLITRCLVEQGASPLVKSLEGQTPYDLAAKGMNGQYKEVMKYLQTVMSEKSSGVTAKQGREGDMVPTEIKLMADKKSIGLYLKLLESGSEKKRDIRLVVVGKKGAGKTSLIRRLLGEDITDGNSTNGIEIHKIKCKTMSDDGIWHKQEENYEDTQTQARLLKQYVGKLQEPVESQRAIKDNTLLTSFDETKKLKTVSKLILKPPEAAEPQSEPPETPQQSSQYYEQVAREIETMITATSKVDVNDKEEYATFLLWDFAGDEDLYHTHQTFLARDAIYLVVTKLNEADDPNAQALFRHWIDTIHYYSRQKDKHSRYDDMAATSGDRYPPVVIVGTWKDDVTSETDKAKIEIACKENYLMYTKELAEDERGHIRCAYFISNETDDHNVFQKIRIDILNLARQMRTWNAMYPLKFIQLEQRLLEMKKKVPIISYQEIKQISTDTAMPLSEDELIFFLKFHHHLRSLVYFKEIPDVIILNPQWLSDAFKCIVKAQKFQASAKNQTQWNTFLHTGKLDYDVLEDIFKEEATVVYEHKDYILNVMEKFDIIIHPNKSEDAEKNRYYYVPSMLKAEPYCDIYNMFNVTEDIGKRSTWLCFKFSFLPPHLFNHLIASLCSRYTVACAMENKQIAMFKGAAVFELEKIKKMRKLLIMTNPSSIIIQVIEFRPKRKLFRYKILADSVTDRINNVISARFKYSNVTFEKKWECGQTKPSDVKGENNFRKLKTTYFCQTCKTTHEFMEEWSGHSNSDPHLQDSTAHTRRQQPDFSDILDQMMTRLVISVKDRRIIERNNDQRDVKEQTLLDIVKRKGEPNTSMCIDILKNHSCYDDHIEKLESHLLNETPLSAPIKDTEEVPDYVVRLQKNYLDIINS